MSLVDLLAILVAATVAAAQATSYDVVVYDASSGGVIAAVAASRHGARVVLICASYPSCFEEGGKIVGGMSAGGLGQTDLGSHPEVVGGFALEFYQRNRAHYSLVGADATSAGCRLPSAKCNATFNLEPHVAQSIFETMLQDAHVDVVYGKQVKEVVKDSGLVRSIQLTDGAAISAKVFIDASYEGDLFARAGVSYAVGREAPTTFGETLAGRRNGMASNQFSVAVNPYTADGDLLPLLERDVDLGKPGDGDTKIQAYNFRLCVTKNQAMQAPFAKPVGYNASEWELLRRYLKACGFENGIQGAGSCQIGFPSCNTQPVPNQKFDMNNCGGLSSDFIGQNFKYPEADYISRKQIWHAHRNYVEGLLWTMANDPGVPSNVRATMNKWGLCKDEFAKTGHFPPALYVREARRLQGDQIFTQNSPSQNRTAGVASIGLGSYNFDSHNAQRFACVNKSVCFDAGPKSAVPTTSFAWNEGDVEINPGIYEIPYWVLLPKKNEVSNVLVVGAPSASHIGLSTLRMEPQFMIMGHAAGIAAAVALNTTDGRVHDISLTSMQKLLVGDGQLVSASPHSSWHTCLGDANGKRCVEVTSHPAKPLDATCDGACKSLQKQEWLALKAHWQVNGSSIKALQDTFLKKTERHSGSGLPAWQQQKEAKGTQLELAASVIDMDGGYWLVQLSTPAFVV